MKYSLFKVFHRELRLAFLQFLQPYWCGATEFCNRNHFPVPPSFPEIADLFNKWGSLYCRNSPHRFIALLAPISQNGQTHSNNSSVNWRRIV